MKKQSARKIFRTWTRGAAVLAAMVVLVCSCRPPGGKGKTEEVVEEAPIPVRVERPAPRMMEEVIEVHGNLEPVEQVDVVTEVSGPVVAVLAEAGDKVTQGQLLARIDDEEYKLNLRQAQTALTVASSDYTSTKSLYDDGMKSRQEYEKIKRTYDDARTNFELNDIRLKNCEIKSPITGVVVTRNAEMYHQAGAMEVLYTVSDLSSYKILITVTEAEVAKIRDGQQVRVRVDALEADPDSFPLLGTVKRIQPRVDPQTGTVQVEVSLPDPGPGARSGMFTRLKIVTAVHENALTVPRRAVSTEDENYVWVVENNLPKMVKIEIGLSDSAGIEVLSGLTRDSNVIVEGHVALTEKSKINVVNPADGDTAAGVKGSE